MEVRIRLYQIPVAKAVLVDAKQELSVILQIPLHIKVGDFHPTSKLEPKGRRLFYFKLSTKDQIY